MEHLIIPLLELIATVLGVIIGWLQLRRADNGTSAVTWGELAGEFTWQDLRKRSQK